MLRQCCSRLPPADEVSPTNLVLVHPTFVCAFSWRACGNGFAVASPPGGPVLAGVSDQQRSRYYQYVGRVRLPGPIFFRVHSLCELARVIASIRRLCELARAIALCRRVSCRGQVIAFCRRVCGANLNHRLSFCRLSVVAVSRRLMC